MAFKKLLLMLRKKIVPVVASPWGTSGAGWGSAGVTGAGTEASKFSVAGPYKMGSYPLGAGYITVATAGFVNIQTKGWTSTPTAASGDNAGCEVYSSVSATTPTTQNYAVYGSSGSLSKVAVTAGNVVRLYSDDAATVWATPMTIWWTAT